VFWMEWMWVSAAVGYGSANANAPRRRDQYKGGVY